MLLISLRNTVDLRNKATFYNSLYFIIGKTFWLNYRTIHINNFSLNLSIKSILMIIFNSRICWCKLEDLSLTYENVIPLANPK